MAKKYPKVKIQEAIDFYNERRKEGEEKMTQGRLADLVIRDRMDRQSITKQRRRQIDPKYKTQTMSRWKHGRQTCDHHYLIAISKTTGVSVDFLLGLTNDPS